MERKSRRKKYGYEGMDSFFKELIDRRFVLNWFEDVDLTNRVETEYGYYIPESYEHISCMPKLYLHPLRSIEILCTSLMMLNDHITPLDIQRFVSGFADSYYIRELGIDGCDRKIDECFRRPLERGEVVTIRKVYPKQSYYKLSKSEKQSESRRLSAMANSPDDVIQLAVDELIRRNERITVSSIATEAKVSNGAAHNFYRKLSFDLEKYNKSTEDSIPSRLLAAAKEINNHGVLITKYRLFSRTGIARTTINKYYTDIEADIKALNGTISIEA
jgi:ribosomal protein S25